MLEGGSIVNCTKPPLISARELLSNILYSTSCNLIIKPDGTPYLFGSEQRYDSQYGYARPRANNILRRNKIIYNSNDNEMPSKIKRTNVEIYEGITIGNSEIIYEGKTVGTTTKTLGENYTDFTITNGRIISSTRFSVTFASNDSSKDTIVYGKRISNENSLYMSDNFIEEDKVGDIIENSFGISRFIEIDDFWFKKWNNSFVANIEFLLDSNLEYRAGTELKIELEKGKAYPRSNVRIKYRCYRWNDSTSQNIMSKRL